MNGELEGIWKEAVMFPLAEEEKGKHQLRKPAF
jgi:hypothetical protein